MVVCAQEPSGSQSARLPAYPSVWDKHSPAFSGSQLYRRNFKYEPHSKVAGLAVMSGTKLEHVPLVSLSHGGTPRKRDNGEHSRWGEHPELQAITVSVCMASGLPVGVNVGPYETVLQVKQRLEHTFGITAEQQRLMWRGVGLPDDRPLAACRVPNGAELRLVQRMKGGSNASAAPPAPRGLLMVPGNRAWRPVHNTRPSMPIVCADVHRPMQMAVEFESLADFHAFKDNGSPQGVAPSHGMRRDEEGPVLEVLGGVDGTEWRQPALLDPVVDVLKVDTRGGLRANSRKEAVVRIPGRQPFRCWVVTGDEMGHGAN